MNYYERLRGYEEDKRKAQEVATSQREYERLIKQAAKKWSI